MSKSKIIEALLVIITALLVAYLFWIFKFGVTKPVFIYLACSIGISGVFIMPFAKLIAKAWYLIVDLLGVVMPKFFFAIVFIVILVPVAALYKLLKKDNLLLKKSSETKWINRNHQYSADDFKNIW